MDTESALTNAQVALDVQVLSLYVTLDCPKTAFQDAMPAEQDAPVLRCELCRKPFNKAATLKRHGYYCRSPKGTSRIARPRSCLHCAKAKARCDNAFPNCGRCTKKSLHCHFPNGSTIREHPREKSLSSIRASPCTTDDNVASDWPSVATSLSIDATEGESLEIARTSFDLSLPELENGEYSVWNLLGAEKTMTPTLNLESASPINLDHNDPPIFRGSLTAEIYEVSHAMGAASVSQPLLSMPNYDLAVRSFMQRPAIKGGASTTCTLMLRLLTSYPIMLRDTKTPPPFIHTSFLSDTESKTMESLITCVSLMQLLESGGNASKKLLWKNIKLECERLQVQWPDLDAWELLSSMQALLIYMLLRLQDGEILYNNFDTLLLSTAWVIGCAMNCKIGNFNCSSPVGLSYGTSYSQWVFEESRRRTSLTFSAIRLLFSTEPAGNCFLTDGYLLAPLPAHKQLWESQNEVQWATAKSHDSRGESVFGVKVGGHMAKINPYPMMYEPAGVLERQELSDIESTANWQEWCAGMDGFGALIMLAASLPI